jgi:hypothetical protein
MDQSVRNPPLSSFVSTAIAAAALLWIAGSATGQSATEKPADEPRLKGPEVKERAVPGVVNSFGQSQEGRRMAERIPPEVLREAFGVLTRDDAPEAIRATPEQEEQFRTVTDELRTASRKYMAEHREELIELRKDANLTGRAAQEIDRAIGRRPGAAGQGGAAGDARRERAQRQEQNTDGTEPMMDEAAQAKQEAARLRLREIMAGSPKIDDYMTRIWENLSVAQREAVDAKLDEYRERETKRREEAYVRQRVNERQPDGAPRRPAGAASGDDMMMQQGEQPAASPQRARQPRPDQPARPAAANAQRRERLMQLFERLSPEQQEMLLERLENAARDGGFGNARQRGQRTPPSSDKPAPAMDEVEVPKPEEVEGEQQPRPSRRPNPA